MKREPLQTEAYFENCINHYNEQIIEESKNIEETPETIKRWDIVYSLLSNAQLYKAICKYSIGSPVEGMQKLVEAAIDNYLISVSDINYDKTKLNDYFGVYCKTCFLVSLSILLHLNTVTINKLGKITEILGGDVLLDKILQLVSEEKAIAKKAAWPKIYLELLQVFDALPESRPEIVKKYLHGWFKNMGKAPWHGSHKYSDKTVFFGYWSFEAAAITFLLNIDDADYRDMKYYPKDLVDYARNKK